MSETGSGEDSALVADWQRIRTGTATVQRRLDDAVEAAGVSAQWFAVLQMLLAAPEQGLPMTVLARDLAMTSGGFTKLVDRMAKEGLVDRRGNAADRRVVHAALTDQGREAAGRAARVYRQALQEALLGQVDRKALAEAGNTLDALTRAHTDGAVDDPDLVRDPALVTAQRDPALPDRRGRGRASE